MKTILIVIALAVVGYYFTTFSSEITPKQNPNIDYSKVKRAYFAGGCFWGVEYHLEKQAGVKDVISGFMGGHVQNPSYYEVIFRKTGHLETVEVLYDPEETSYETLAKHFFEIHDFTQTDGQGPDIGEQYLSAIFYSNEEEKQTAQKLIDILSDKGYKVATTLREAKPFYAADGGHQNYYQRKGTLPYCHSYTKVFD